MKTLVLQGFSWNLGLSYNLCKDREDGYVGGEDSVACCQHFFDGHARFVVELYMLGTPARALRGGQLLHEAVHAAHRIAEYLAVTHRLTSWHKEEAVAELTVGIHAVGHHWLSKRCGISAANDKVYDKILQDMQAYVENI